MSLPSGYTQLEYIESDNSSYLDTGVTMGKTDSVTLEEVLTPFGTSDTRYTGANGYMQIAITSSGYSINGTAKKSLGTKDKLKCIYTSTTESLYINGALVESSDWSSYNGANVKIGLFKMGDAGNAWYSGKAHSGKCYGASIIKNGVKVREFIPCKNASGVAGMWDDVSKSFFSSASSFAFIAGSVYIGTHKTLVNGTVYEVKGGKCLVNGTVYNILKGRTLIGGTGYDITFPESLVMPVKGDLITMNLDGTDRQYRVLKIVDGTTVEVLGMWDDINNCPFGTNTRYSISVLDTKLNTTWYDALSATAKAAIVPKNITQDYWYWATDIVYGSPHYSGFYGRTYPGTSAYIVSKDTVATPVDIGSRYVYAMSIQEVIDYLSDSNVLYQKDVMLMNANIWKAFWNKTTNPGTTSVPVLLRSIWSNEANRVWCADQSYGYLGDYYIGTGGIARPAFQIDLSKIDFIIN